MVPNMWVHPIKHLLNHLIIKRHENLWFLRRVSSKITSNFPSGVQRPGRWISTNLAASARTWLRKLSLGTAARMAGTNCSWSCETQNDQGGIVVMGVTPSHRGSLLSHSRSWLDDWWLSGPIWGYHHMDKTSLLIQNSYIILHNAYIYIYIHTLINYILYCIYIYTLYIIYVCVILYYI